MSLADARRIYTIDFIRGVALLGILLINIVSFSMPEATYFVPRQMAGYSFGNLDGFNDVLRTQWYFLGEGKFVSTFAMLFGVSVLMLRERSIASGKGLWAHYARMIVLLVIGCIHAYLLWYGDILFTYALAGMVVVWFVFSRNWVKWAAGLLAYLIPLGLMIVLGLTLMWGERYVMAGRDSGQVNDLVVMYDELREGLSYSDDEIQQEIADYRGRYSQQLSRRAASAFYMQSAVAFMFLGPTIGMMLLGMILYRAGWFTSTLNFSSAIICAAVMSAGFGFQFLAELGNQKNAYDPMYGQFVWYPLFIIGTPLIAVGYAKILATLALNLPVSVTKWFANIGKMSLSNYLLQTVICTTLFYGHGLGWFATLDRTGLVPVILGVWLANIVFSAMWLNYFQIGPMEWIYRTGAKAIGG